MSCMALTNNQKNELLFVGFNQDYGCFACGTDNGFRIYNVDPYRETFRRVFSNGGVGIVEMLFRCNLLALVGGGRNPRYPLNKVMIWDDHQSRCIGELSFRSEVKAVRLRRDRVVVVLDQRIYVYRFSDLHLLDRINTIRNDAGLVALCADASNMVLACPGVSRGHVNVELYDLRRSTLIPAHESELAQLALSMDGKMVATASVRGTLLRVFDTDTGLLLHELRRGMDRAEISSICFNQQSTFVACCSDRGTAHIFSLEAGSSRVPSGNTAAGGSGAASSDAGTSNGSSGTVLGGNVTGSASTSKTGRTLIGMLPGLPNYFNSVWSYAQIRGIEARTVCAFGREPRTIVLISEDGSFLTARFNEPGECERISYARFLSGAGGSDDEGEGKGVPSRRGAIGAIVRTAGEILGGGSVGGTNGDIGGAGAVGGGSGAGGRSGSIGQPASAQTPTSVSRRPSESARQPPPVASTQGYVSAPQCSPPMRPSQSPTVPHGVVDPTLPPDPLYRRPSSRPTSSSSAASVPGALVGINAGGDLSVGAGLKMPAPKSEPAAPLTPIGPALKDSSVGSEGVSAGAWPRANNEANSLGVKTISDEGGGVTEGEGGGGMESQTQSDLGLLPAPTASSQPQEQASAAPPVIPKSGEAFVVGKSDVQVTSAPLDIEDLSETIARTEL